jgi:TRAP-type C4-dicarboxylate transport system substrate-binding protein
VLLSKRTWDKLSAEERTIIQDALNEAKAYQRQVSREKNTQMLDAVKKAGMQVNEVSPPEIARIREKIKPVVEKYTKEVSQALVDEVNAEVAKKRGSN